MRPVVIQKRERFWSLRVEFDAVLGELKYTTDWARRLALLDHARRISNEAKKLVNTSER